MGRNNKDFHWSRMGKALGFSQGGSHTGDGLKPSGIDYYTRYNTEDTKDAEVSEIDYNDVSDAEIKDK